MITVLEKHYLILEQNLVEMKIKLKNLILQLYMIIIFPYFEEANIAIFCKKLFAQEYKPESFIDQELNEKIYPNSDHHTLYIGSN